MSCIGIQNQPFSPERVWWVAPHWGGCFSLLSFFLWRPLYSLLVLRRSSRALWEQSESNEKNKSESESLFHSAWKRQHWSLWSLRTFIPTVWGEKARLTQPSLSLLLWGIWNSLQAQICLGADRLYKALAWLEMKSSWVHIENVSFQSSLRYFSAQFTNTTYVKLMKYLALLKGIRPMFKRTQ